MALPSSVPPDPVIEAYKKDVDRFLLRENLKINVEERLRKLASMLPFLEDWCGAATQRSARL